MEPDSGESPVNRRSADVIEMDELTEEACSMEYT